MLKILIIGSFILFSSVSQSDEFDCFSSADENWESSHQFQFLGPRNNVWKYVNSDPQSWKFKIKSKTGKFDFPKSIKLLAPYPEMNDNWSKFFTASKDNVISVVPEQVEKLKLRLSDFLAKKRDGFRPFVQLHFSVGNTSQECEIGLGFNKFTLTIDNEPDLLFLKDHKLFIKISSQQKLDVFEASRIEKNQVMFDGLPPGEYRPEIVYSSDKISGGFSDFDSLDGFKVGAHCKASLQRDKKDKYKWILLNNSCAE